MAKKDKSSCNCTAWSALALRLALGIVFVFAGWAKLSAGPAGFGGALAGIGFPAAVFFAWVVALVEFIGGIMLILGLWSRWAAVPVGVIAIVAMLLKWAGNFGSSGFADLNAWRLDLMLIAAALAVYWLGNGAYALQAAFNKK